MAGKVKRAKRLFKASFFPFSDLHRKIIVSTGTIVLAYSDKFDLHPRYMYL